MDYGLFPADTHRTLPPRMDGYIKQGKWDDPVLGGYYNWEGPSWGEGGGYSYAGISLESTPAAVDVVQELDERIDDGDLSTGNFRLTPNGRYTFIIEER
jgi:type IV pilus assembly protein PilA